MCRSGEWSFYMVRSRGRWVAGAFAGLAFLVPASLAWACVAPQSLTTSSPTVQPGGTVHIIGRESGPGAPIEIHLDAADGPLLTTVTGQPGGMTSKWEWDVPIPATTPYGKHVLFAVQNYRNMNATFPKATIYVGTEPDPAPTPDARPRSLDVGSGRSATTLVLLGLGVAAGGLLLVGGLTALAGSSSSSRPEPEAERVKTS
jgi:hypothetical protein